MITKSTNFEAKDIDLTKGMAKIAFATFNSKDRDKDVARSGMFNKSWTESKSDVRFFLNHDKDQAPGVPVELHDNGSQGIMVVKFGRHTLGKDVLYMLEDGIITDNSYGFDPIPEKTFKMKDGGREFKEVKLWEVSVLTHWGAHPDSKVMEVGKSADMQMLSAQIKVMKKFCRDTQATDETIESILKQIELAETIVSKYDTAFTQTDVPQDETNEPDASVIKERAAADSLAWLALSL